MNKQIDIDNVLELKKKADKYDILKPIIKAMFEADNTRDFLEAQRQLKNELRFLP